MSILKDAQPKPTLYQPQTYDAKPQPTIVSTLAIPYNRLPSTSPQPTLLA